MESSSNWPLRQPWRETVRLRDAAPRTGERRSRQKSRDHCRRFPSRGKHPQARAPTVERVDAGESFSELGGGGR